MATADRVLAVLGLFTLEEPVWTVEAAARRLGLSSSTAYGYVRSLVDAGLLVAAKSGRYTVGPAVISLDRLTRRHDALVRAAQPGMGRLAGLGDGGVVALLCRSFRLQVMCVDQCSTGRPGFAISYERGRPMPLYAGAASKAILAHLPPRTLRKLWTAEGATITASGLGADLPAFRGALRDLRRQGVAVTRGEIDIGLVGVSAPVFAGGEVAGSLGVVASAEALAAEPALLPRLVSDVGEQAALTTQDLAG